MRVTGIVTRVEGKTFWLRIEESDDTRGFYNVGETVEMSCREHEVPQSEIGKFISFRTEIVN